MAVLSGQLSTDNHDRDVMGMRYVYPVVSRRAGGVSVGINLNPNNACNWHCAYCQVEGLQRGVAPEMDAGMLEGELRAMLTQLCFGDFMQVHVPEGCRRLCDVAISGNGEPTSCRDFSEVVACIQRVMAEFDLCGMIPLRLISNASYVHQSHVQAGLKMMAEYAGEVWAKVDAASPEAIARINGVKLKPERLQQQVVTAASCCPTWIQTCWMAWNGQSPSEEETQRYLDFLREVNKHAELQGVLLYGLARPSMQTESVHVSAASGAVMQALKARIEALGLMVQLSL